MKRTAKVDCGIAIATLCGTLGGMLGVVAAHAAEDQSVETVTVTGSRIQQNEFDAPTPTISLSSDAIELSGTANLTDLLRSQPALVGSEDSTRTTNDFIGSNGLNLLNLRNLGTDRTLVLVDGRRHVAQLPETAAVDINTIPADLVERIDIVTGGVSAVYGADAVSGVVNFVMRKNFEGLIGRLQYGSADRGNPSDLQASLTGGFNFANGRGNLSGSIQHAREGRLRASERSYLRGANYTSMQQNPDDDPDDPGVPDRIPINDLRFDSSSREGAIDIDGDFIADLRPDGTAYDLGTFIPPFYAQGGTSTPVADYLGDLLSKNENTIASLFLNFELNPSANLFAEAKFARGTAVGFDQPTFDFFLFFEPDNPYISPALAAQTPGGFFVHRDNFDLGVRGEDNTRETIRTVLGVNGGFLDDYSYEVSYVYGQTEIDSLAINNRYNDRFLAAIDVVTDPLTGAPTCRSNLDPSALPYDPVDDFSGLLSFTPGANSGCLPLNILGEGVATAEAIDWVMLNSRTRSRITQNVFTAFASGPVPGITLPAGAIDAVAGVEWRRETSRSNPPWEDQAGLTFGNVILPTDGSFDVKEAFVELRAPLLKDLAYTELLQLSGAARVSDYSTVGSTTTWNLGALWAPVRDVSFRATVSESVRAPNIGELFGPQSQTFEQIDDPCDVGQLGNGTSYRAANCTAILGALGIDPVGYRDPNAATIPGLSQGNATLSEETARSYTFGTVLRPRFAPGLALAIDYYDINIKKAISTATAQVVANTCVDQPSIDNLFCDALTRNAATGAIDSFIVQPENVASYRTRGIDFNVNYLLDPARLGVKSYIGSFGISLVGSRLARLTTIPTIGADQIDERTTAYAPKLQTSLDLNWYFHGFTASYGYDHFSKTSRYDLLTRAGNPDIASPENIDYDAYDMHTLTLAFDFEGGYRLHAGVRNLTDERPDYSLNYPISPVGRFYYGGFKMSFGAAR